MSRTDRLRDLVAAGRNAAVFTGAGIRTGSIVSGAIFLDRLQSVWHKKARSTDNLCTL